MYRTQLNTEIKAQRVIRQFKKGRRYRGQSLIEYTLLFVIVAGAFVGMANYFKRGIQGRWKSSIENFGGEQYDPRFANTNIRHNLVKNTETTIRTMNTDGGKWTYRIDKTQQTDSKTGSRTIGAY